MSSKKVKALRKQVYGEYSRKTRSYKVIPHILIRKDEDGNSYKIRRDSRVNTGLRRRYLELKKSHNDNIIVTL